MRENENDVKVLAEINLPLPINELAAALTSLQGVFPDARVEAHYSSALRLVVDDEKAPAGDEPAAA